MKVKMKTQGKRPLVKGLLIMVVTFCSATMLMGKDGIKFQHMTLNQAIAKAKKENKNLFIDVYATWCGPCKYLSNNVFTDQGLGEYMNDNFICLKLDGEQEDGRSLMTEFELSAYPTMLFMSPESKLLKKIVGVEMPNSIKTEAEYIVNPSKHPLFEARKQYANGKRDRAFVSELILNTLDNGEDPSEMVKEFVKNHPQLDMSKESELAIFVMGIYEPENPNYQEFLKNTGKYVAINQQLCEAKMDNLLNMTLLKALESSDRASIETSVHSIYDAYKTIYTSNSLEKKDLTKALLAAYDEQQ